MCHVEQSLTYVTINAACALASCSRRTIYNWIRLGKVRVVKVPSGAMRVCREDLMRPVEGK